MRTESPAVTRPGIRRAGELNASRRAGRHRTADDDRSGDTQGYRDLADARLRRRWEREEALMRTRIDDERATWARRLVWLGTVAFLLLYIAIGCWLILSRM
jgi:hypothetical protein